MILLHVVQRLMLPLTWVASRKRALKLAQTERRLLDWHHPDYKSARKPAELVKTIPASTC
jgi:hypothetical protein